MASLHGPHSVSSQYQVKLPVRIARALSITAGDEFFWRVTDDDPWILQLVPAEVVERRYAVGEGRELAARDVDSRTTTNLPDGTAPTPKRA